MMLALDFGSARSAFSMRVVGWRRCPLYIAIFAALMIGAHFSSSLLM
jgi:hypothetical protein